jgi:hypothetical protein
MKYILPFFLIAFVLGNFSVNAQQTHASLAEHSANNAGSDFTFFKTVISKDRVTLDWAVGNNGDADRFEVERSADGKNFKMIALVFTSEDDGAANYSYFERLKNKKQYYRLKKISKDQKVEYSGVVVVE